MEKPGKATKLIIIGGTAERFLTFADCAFREAEDAGEGEDEGMTELKSEGDLKPPARDGWLKEAGAEMWRAPRPLPEEIAWSIAAVFGVKRDGA